MSLRGGEARSLPWRLGGSAVVGEGVQPPELLVDGLGEGEGIQALPEGLGAGRI